jgi:hypothetical protein
MKTRSAFLFDSKEGKKGSNPENTGFCRPSKTGLERVWMCSAILKVI